MGCSILRCAVAIGVFALAAMLFQFSCIAQQIKSSKPAAHSAYEVPSGVKAKLDALQAQLKAAQKSGDRKKAATAFNDLGIVYDDLGEKQKALEYYDHALVIERELGNRADEASTLFNMGSAYGDLGEKQKALEHYDQALKLEREAGDREGEAATLSNMGLVYDDLGELEKALEFYNQALPMEREADDQADLAGTLSNIGATYSQLGDERKAIEFYEQALPVEREAGDRDAEATTLNNIGLAYAHLGEPEKALVIYKQALPISREVGDRAGEAITLINIGSIYDDAGDKQKALYYYNQALPIQRAVGNRNGEAITLNNIGHIYVQQNERVKGLADLNQALLIAEAVGDLDMEAVIFNNMMDLEHKQQPALAIYYGKRAVNLIQQERGNIKGLDKEVQMRFLTTKSDTYHYLADLLIDEGRLPEAEQVLDLLKEQEYTEFVRGENRDTLGKLALTPAEKQANEEYARSTSQLVALGRQWAELKKIKQRTPEQEQQYRQLSEQIDHANKSFSDYLGRLYEVFGKSATANKQVAEISGESKSLQQSIAKLPNTVALYTIVGEDRYRVIVITGSTMVARESEIKGVDLNKKVSAFLDVLHNPAKDPKPLAQELYKFLVAPVKADLDQAQAATLVFSLDGALRYIPMEALYDGKQYLVEQYAIVTFNPASIPYLNDKPDVSNLSAAALGISRQYEHGLIPLPSVESELNDIVKDPSINAVDGVLPGSILLNGRFTETALEQQLDDQHPVLHIASHFVLKPGDDTKSFLLLAGKDKPENGYHLTVAEFRDNPRLSLNDTTLLTLSACDTGVTSNASNGREVDGLAMIAQRDKHAKSVLSTLWPVNDASTGLLMADFYKRWAEGGGKVMKVEALREAQLDMLYGKLTPRSSAADRGVISEESKPNNLAGFTHPFFWAPFVLMGNWR
jgi:CHAT domain-containing protein/Tfp pilus assembly protein PilF